jgi:hypothetical protein
MFALDSVQLITGNFDYVGMYGYCVGPCSNYIGPILVFGLESLRLIVIALFH